MAGRATRAVVEALQTVCWTVEPRRSNAQDAGVAICLEILADALSPQAA